MCSSHVQSLRCAGIVRFIPIANCQNGRLPTLLLKAKFAPEDARRQFSPLHSLLSGSPLNGVASQQKRRPLAGTSACSLDCLPAIVCEKWGFYRESDCRPATEWVQSSNCASSTSAFKHNDEMTAIILAQGGGGIPTLSLFWSMQRKLHRFSVGLLCAPCDLCGSKSPEA